MDLIRKFINLILYSSVFVAAGAASLVLLSMELAGGKIAGLKYTAFTFFSVILLYSIHRIIGIKRVSAFEHHGRFAVIKKYRHHILAYGFFALVAAGYLFITMPGEVKYLITLPAVISLLYVIPFLPGRKRFRDLHLVKIFTIAIAWAWVTASIPQYLIYHGFSWPMLISFLERALFIFAITVPFDIRDLEVDAHTGVRTLPSIMGIRGSKMLALSCLFTHLIFVAHLSSTGFYAGQVIVPFLILFIVTGILIYRSAPGRDDYYFSGLLDGTMILQWLLVSGWQQLTA